MDNYIRISSHISENIDKLKKSDIYRRQVFVKEMIEKLKIFDVDLHVFTDQKHKYIDISRFRTYTLTQPYGELIDLCVKDQGYYNRIKDPVSGNIILEFI